MYKRQVNGFVDEPRSSVQEIDALYEELTARLTDLFGERRRALRAAWHDDAAEPQTEELRLVLRDYRDAIERLLAVCRADAAAAGLPPRRQRTGAVPVVNRPCPTEG